MFELLIFIALNLIVAVPCWKIVARAGFNPAWSLVYLVPLVNIIALWMLAVKDWPAAADRRGGF